LQQEVRIIRYAPARTSEHPLPYPAGGARPHESLLRPSGMSGCHPADGDETSQPALAGGGLHPRCDAGL